MKFNNLSVLDQTDTLGSTNDETLSDNITIIAPVIVVIAVLAVAFLLCFLLYRHRKNREETAKLDPGTPSMSFRGIGNFPAVSVKDHINMLSADDLLKSKIPINDVKLIRQYPVDRVAYEKDLGQGQFGQVFQGNTIDIHFPVLLYFQPFLMERTSCFQSVAYEKTEDDLNFHSTEHYRFSSFLL